MMRLKSISQSTHNQNNRSGIMEPGSPVPSQPGSPAVSPPVSPVVMYQPGNMGMSTDNELDMADNRIYVNDNDGNINRTQDYLETNELKPKSNVMNTLDDLNSLSQDKRNKISDIDPSSDPEVIGNDYQTKD